MQTCAFVRLVFHLQRPDFKLTIPFDKGSGRFPLLRIFYGHRDILERTLGYFVDPSVAFVQTPQDFYNVDSFQHRGSADAKEAWHEQTLYYRVIQPGKDRLNATCFCGSCAVISRQALDDIGGFPQSAA